VSSDDKKLMSEVLPAPSHAKGGDGRARERVAAHMKRLVGIGAASAALTACPPPFAVVDPLPPPARCKTMNDVLSELSAGVEASDSGSTLTLTISAKTDYSSGVELDMAGGTIGGSITGLVRAPDSKKMTVTITPSSAEVQLTLTVSCSGEARTVRVKIDVATASVTLSDPSRDGG
jgi:hypothetical protein